MEISVLIAVYNGETSIGRTLDSLLPTLPPDSEIIIVDDGSTDHTTSVIQAVGDPRIRLLRQDNQGPAAAANAGLREVRGRFTARLDCGDLCHPDRMRLQRDFLDQHPDVLMVGCRVRRRDAAGNELGCQEIVTEPERVYRGLMRTNLFQHSSVMLRSDALQRVGGYRPFFRFSLDLDLFLRLAELGPLASLPQVLSEWVLEPDSISFKYRGAQMEFARLSRESARARREGQPDPVDLGALRAPALTPDPEQLRQHHYELELARSALMGDRTRIARATVAGIASRQGWSMQLLAVYGLSLAPACLRRALRRLRVQWLTR